MAPLILVMISIAKRALIFALLAMLPVLSYGQISSPMAFSVFWPCAGNSLECVPRILASGIIERNSYNKLSAFISNRAAHAHQLGAKPVICFNSPGGDLAGAMELGRFIRRRGLQTCLESSYSRVPEGPEWYGPTEVFATNVVCASACAFALVGGINRYIESGSRFGVHQFYGRRENIGDSATQVTVVLLAAYLEQMGVSRSLLDTASLVAPNSIYWLSPEELRVLGADNMTVANSKWRLDALNDGTVVANISQVKPGTQNRVSLFILKRNGQPFMRIALTLGEVYASSLMDAYKVLNRREISLQIDEREVDSYQSAVWRVVQGSVETELPLSPNLVRSLRTGKMFKLQVTIARYVEGYDPSIELSLDGATAVLAAALK